MNIYKKGKLKNLTNKELEKMLKESYWNDNDLLREYEERFQNGKARFKPENMKEHMRLIDFVTRPLPVTNKK